MSSARVAVVSIFCYKDNVDDLPTSLFFSDLTELDGRHTGGFLFSFFVVMRIVNEVEY